MGDVSDFNLSAFIRTVTTSITLGCVKVNPKELGQSLEHWDVADVTIPIPRCDHVRRRTHGTNGHTSPVVFSTYPDSVSNRKGWCH